MLSSRDKYIIARWMYSIGEDYISDMEYRYLEDKVREENPDDEYLSRSWSDDPCPILLLRENGLESAIRDIEFIHKSESIPPIYVENEYRKYYAALNEDTRVSFKIDGWNTQVNYYNGHVVSANTRGRGGNFLNAEVVKCLVPAQIPIMGRVKVTGETSIPKSKWKAYAALTGNTSQRNSVSTAMARGDVEYLSFLAFSIQVESENVEGDIYDKLVSLGFKTPMCMHVTNFSGLDKAIRLMGMRNKGYDYLTDGIVAENSSGQKALRVYEWEEKSVESYVVGYVENRGSYGISMVAEIYPVTRDGITRSRVNVTNIKYIVENDLEVGSPIAFDIRSAANAVLNVERTKELQRKWEGRYEEYQEVVKSSSL